MARRRNARDGTNPIEQTTLNSPQLRTWTRHLRLIKQEESLSEKKNTIQRRRLVGSGSIDHRRASRIQLVKLFLLLDRAVLPASSRRKLT